MRAATTRSAGVVRLHFIGAGVGRDMPGWVTSEPAGGRAGKPQGRGWGLSIHLKDGLCHNPSYFWMDKGAFPVAKPGERGVFVKKNVHTLVMPISRESLSEL
jgi:hypothetical protein